MKKILKRFVRYFISFILCLVIFLIAFLSIINITLFNDGFVIKHIDKTQFSEKAYNEIIDSFVSLGSASGVPKEVFEKAINISFVSTDIYNIISDSYKNNELSFAKNDLILNLKSEISNFCNENNIEITDSIKNDIDLLLEHLVSEYESVVILPLFSQIIQIKSIFDGYYFAFLIGSIFYLAFSVFILLFLEKWPHRRIRYISYSFIASGLMLLIIPIITAVWDGIKRIQITPKFMYDFVVSFFNGIINQFYIFGAILFLIGVILMVISGKLRQKAK